MELKAQSMADSILESGKYAHISRETVTRLCLECLPRYKSLKEAQKAVKKRLHIIHGAFFPDRCHEGALTLIADSGYDEQALSLTLMALHPSTRERLPFLQPFYSLLAPYLKNARTVLDVGCGFHPLALPFMGLPGDALYMAGDIDHQTVAMVEAFFKRLGRPCQVSILDAAAGIPQAPVDVAFLFKLIPVLEQQQKGLGYRLMGELEAKTIVATFPTKSLSGREKSMEAFYAAQFEESLPKGLAILEKETVGAELIYLVGGHS